MIQPADGSVESLRLTVDPYFVRGEQKDEAFDGQSEELNGGCKDQEAVLYPMQHQAMQTIKILEGQGIHGHQNGLILIEARVLVQAVPNLGGQLLYFQIIRRQQEVNNSWTLHQRCLITHPII